MNFGRVRHVKVPDGAKIVYQGIMFDVFQWTASLYDGSTAVHEMARRSDSVAVVAREGNRILVTEQEQPDVERPFYDFPGGRIDPGEDRIQAARRELLEETGYSGALSLLFEFQATDRVDSRTYVYRCDDLTRVAIPEPDAGERVSVTWLSLDEIKKWSIVNHRLAIVPVLLASDVDDLFERQWLNG